jgi:hypothetical protein
LSPCKSSGKLLYNVYKHFCIHTHTHIHTLLQRASRRVLSGAFPLFLSLSLSLSLSHLLPVACISLFLCSLLGHFSFLTLPHPSTVPTHLTQSRQTFVTFPCFLTFLFYHVNLTLSSTYVLRFVESALLTRFSFRFFPPAVSLPSTLLDRPPTPTLVQYTTSTCSLFCPCFSYILALPQHTRTRCDCSYCSSTFTKWLLPLLGSRINTIITERTGSGHLHTGRCGQKPFSRSRPEARRRSGRSQLVAQQRHLLRRTRRSRCLITNQCSHRLPLECF